MPEYGLKIGNLPRIMGDRRIMRLLTMGDTQAVSGSRHKFRLHCQHADFCVYFRPLHQGVATASQIIHAVGGGVYDAYFIGSPCRVYVYERKHTRAASGKYGIQLFNKSGSVAFDNLDEPMMPLPNLYIPPLGQGGKVLLFDAATTPHRAVNMHGNRLAMSLDFWRDEYRIYRDAILLENAALFYVFGYGTNNYAARNGDGIPLNWTSANRFGGLSNQKPTSIGVCNTFEHGF